MKLKKEYYLEEDVKKIARDLLGKFLITNFGDGVTSGIITETEAYEGVTDRASHAFGGRLTDRTRMMYEEGGIAYVYLCYGVHSLFNVVTHRKGIPHAVLIRSMIPADGGEIIRKRIGKKMSPAEFQKCGTGPGRLSKALGIHYSHTGSSLLGPAIWLEDRGLELSDSLIRTGPRIGVDYAGEDARLPYRFYIESFNL